MQHRGRAVSPSLAPFDDGHCVSAIIVLGYFGNNPKRENQGGAASRGAAPYPGNPAGKESRPEWVFFQDSAGISRSEDVVSGIGLLIIETHSLRGNK